APDKVDNKRKKNHEQDTECDRVLRRPDDSEAAATELFSSALEVEHREQLAEVIERVIPSPPFDYGEESDDCPANCQQPDEELHIRACSNQADNEVEDDEETHEERLPLKDIRAQGTNTFRVDEIRH